MRAGNHESGRLPTPVANPDPPCAEGRNQLADPPARDDSRPRGSFYTFRLVRIAMAIRQTEWEGVYVDRAWLYSRNFVPGVSVYGEPLIREGQQEFRRWDAYRSKCAAYLKRGGRHWPFRATSRVLYLGAGTGTTISHLSDICHQ